MKKKIGEIYNKPIVTGDKNLVTKNEIHESSLGSNSGGYGGVKEYYYKILEDTDDAMMLISQLCNIKRAICSFKSETGEIIYKETAVWHYLIYHAITSPIAIVINDEEPVVISQSNTNPKIQTSYIAKGNLINRLILLTKSMGSDITYEMAQSQIESYVQEITKEEYESLITQ